MKNLITMIVLLIAGTINAQTFDFSCAQPFDSVTHNGITATISADETTLTIVNEAGEGITVDNGNSNAFSIVFSIPGGHVWRYSKSDKTLIHTTHPVTQPQFSFAAPEAGTGDNIGLVEFYNQFTGTSSPVPTDTVTHGGITATISADGTTFSLTSDTDNRSVILTADSIDDRGISFLYGEGPIKQKLYYRRASRRFSETTVGSFQNFFRFNAPEAAGSSEPQDLGLVGFFNLLLPPPVSINIEDLIFSSAYHTTNWDNIITIPGEFTPDEPQLIDTATIGGGNEEFIGIYSAMITRNAAGVITTIDLYYLTSIDPQASDRGYEKITLTGGTQEELLEQALNLAAWSRGARINLRLNSKLLWGEDLGTLYIGETFSNGEALSVIRNELNSSQLFPGYEIWTDGTISNPLNAYYIANGKIYLNPNIFVDTSPLKVAYNIQDGLSSIAVENRFTTFVKMINANPTLWRFADTDNNFFGLETGKFVKDIRSNSPNRRVLDITPIGEVGTGILNNNTTLGSLPTNSRTMDLIVGQWYYAKAGSADLIFRATLPGSFNWHSTTDYDTIFALGQGLPITYWPIDNDVTNPAKGLLKRVSQTNLATYFSYSDVGAVGWNHNHNGSAGFDAAVNAIQQGGITSLITYQGPALPNFTYVLITGAGGGSEGYWIGRSTGHQMEVLYVSDPITIIGSTGNDFHMYQGLSEETPVITTFN